MCFKKRLVQSLLVSLMLGPMAAQASELQSSVKKIDPHSKEFQSQILAAAPPPSRINQKSYTNTIAMAQSTGKLADWNIEIDYRATPEGWKAIGYRLTRDENQSKLSAIPSKKIDARKDNEVTYNKDVEVNLPDPPIEPGRSVGEVRTYEFDQNGYSYRYKYRWGYDADSKAMRWILKEIFIIEKDIDVQMP